MHFTEADIEELGEAFKGSLRKGAGQLGAEAPTLTELQDWMTRNHVDRPDVMELILRKLGPGIKAGEKKMSRLR